MPSPRELTRAEVIRAARTFRWHRKMPKWTAIVEGRELPARPLVLEAGGVPPNDPTNSHQAVAILENLGFETRYAGARIKQASGGEASEAPSDSGSLLDSIAAITRGVPEKEWERIPADFSKNVEHYLYGTKKNAK